MSKTFTIFAFSLSLLIPAYSYTEEPLCAMVEEQPSTEESYTIHETEALAISLACIPAAYLTYMVRNFAIQEAAKTLELLSKTPPNQALSEQLLIDEMTYRHDAANLNRLFFVYSLVSVASLVYFIYKNYTAYQDEKNDDKETALCC